MHVGVVYNAKVYTTRGWPQPPQKRPGDREVFCNSALCSILGRGFEPLEGHEKLEHSGLPRPVLAEQDRPVCGPSLSVREIEHLLLREAAYILDLE